MSDDKLIYFHKYDHHDGKELPEGLFHGHHHDGDCDCGCGHDHDHDVDGFHAQIMGIYSQFRIQCSRNYS